MKDEIERKFLVKDEFKPFVKREIRIEQAYLSTTPNTVRVRIADGICYITIKGKSTDNGLIRPEWEKEISLDEAKSLMELCIETKIEKTRHFIPEESGLLFEVDVFYGENEGLVLAEIELPTKNSTFVKPDWIGEEVTGDKKYYNSMLISNPYSEWGKES